MHWKQLFYFKYAIAILREYHHSSACFKFNSKIIINLIPKLSIDSLQLLSLRLLKCSSTSSCSLTSFGCLILLGTGLPTPSKAFFILLNHSLHKASFNISFLILDWWPDGRSASMYDLRKIKKTWCRSAAAFPDHVGNSLELQSLLRLNYIYLAKWNIKYRLEFLSFEINKSKSNYKEITSKPGGGFLRYCSRLSST